MPDVAALFPDSYEASRSRFRAGLLQLRERWPDARLAQHALSVDRELTIDWILADATRAPERLLIVTTGEHGAEGYVGAAMLTLFLQEHAARLDPAVTGLRLVHALNPWGMQHRRRVNAANVDLNRNFLPRPQTYAAQTNPGYDRLAAHLNPAGRVPARGLRDLAFAAALARALTTVGPATLQAATLLGQYRHPQGVYYGGDALQEEAEVMIGLLHSGLRDYRQVLHLDMHTGYGPRYRLSLVNSPHEPRRPNELAALFEYPRVLAADPQQFYAIHGDMVDFAYTLARAEFPDRRLYATAFEFGTFGDTLPAALRSLRAMVWENQLHWHGAATAEAQAAVAEEFRELFEPSEPGWRIKAVADANEAFAGILRAEGFTPS